ncbi:hypothetical protein CHS0354_009068 [Potamilus streckersoni]|uniref:non-specific serine/threonine protein kinase n=1 Tax=Potamilus streckersoni TaxID=2493646 RepID=A0AAE0THT9_9BIVA|nr:hypothetical protein CHS0354_009068 [Potamilus streckersoni]
MSDKENDDSSNSIRSQDSVSDSPPHSLLTSKEIKDFEVWPNFQVDQTEIQGVMLVLQQSLEPDMIKEALIKLQELFEHDAVHEYLEDNHIHHYVIAVMRKIIRPDIQQIGCMLLCQFVEKSEILRDSIIQSDIYKFLVQILNENISDPLIQLSCMKIFDILLQSDTLRLQLIIDEYQQDIVHLLGVAITAFRGNHDIQIAAYKAFGHLLQDDIELQGHFVDKTLIILLELLLSESTSPEVQQHILHILVIIANSEKYMPVLVENDVHCTAIDLLGKTTLTEGVASECLELLHGLIKDSSLSVQEMMVTSGYMETKLGSVLKNFLESHCVQRAGLKLLNLLVGPVLQKSLELGTKTNDISYNFLNIINAAMSNNREQKDIVILGCDVASKILEVHPMAHIWIGDATDEKQVQIHVLCLGAMLMYLKSPEVFSATCEAIYWLAADNDRLCKSIMGRNIHIAVLTGMRQHRKVSTAVESGCRVLRGLCIFNETHKLAVLKDQALSLLINFLSAYENDAFVQVEVISAIACLADVAHARNQCLIENAHMKIIKSMTRFQDNQMLQEAGLEALAILAGAAGGPESLVHAGALSVILKTLKQYPEELLIQKKGLMLFQLFSKQELLDLDTLYHDIASVVSRAMKNFPENMSIQNEACVAIQLLAETGKMMSEKFIQVGCHHHLFDVLKLSEEYTDLQDLAGECLYVLSQEQNLKSVMLLSACQRGNIPATQCLLELGADVNFRQGQETPLFIAVAQENESLVRLLMKQEIRDLEKPLAESLSKGNKKIIGSILEQIGFDRENGAITWSNLQLNDLDPDWILSTLTSHSSIDQDLESKYSSWQLLVKIKDSEQKRLKRLKHSKSDSYLLREKEVKYRIAVRRHHSEKSQYGDQQKSPIFNRPPFKPLAWNGACTIASNQPTTQQQPFEVLPPIYSTSPKESEVNVVFDLSTEEVEEWKQTTLTGANIPFNPKDPRQSTEALEHEDLVLDTITVSGMWMRKRSRSPRNSYSTQCMRPRRESLPFMPNKNRKRVPTDRKFSIDLQSDAESANLTEHILTSLDISNNTVTSLENLLTASQLTLKCFSKLRKINLSSNKLRNIPGELFEHLPKLEKLNLEKNFLTDFPSASLSCPDLKELHLSHNKIKTATFDCCNASLRKLDLSHNEIEVLEDNIGIQLFNLVELHLNNNCMVSLPETSLGLKKLEILNISHNVLTCIPEDFLHTCVKLKFLDASFNRLDSLPNEALALTMIKLSKLNMRRNCLIEKEPFYIPKFILHLPSLMSLDLSENNLMGLPSISMWKSTLMRELLVSRNNISKLNLEGAKAWTKLEKLNLSRNNLSELPREIGQLTYLSSLDISHNKQLTTLPDELGKCSKLWELPMEGLSLNQELRQVLGKKGRVKDLIIYLHNKLKNAKSYYRMKLMVVGYGGRGKTTLLHTLMKGRQSKREDRPTVGVVVRDWKYERQVEDKWGKVVYTLNTWDFAGQEEFYSTHQCYLSNRAVYLVVFSLIKGMSDIDQLKSWLSSIHSRAPGCPVIVVGTHLDRLSEGDRANIGRKVHEKLREVIDKPGFPSITGKELLVDSTTENSRMDKLRTLIKNTVDSYKIKNVPVMGALIPASYVTLSDLLLEEAQKPHNSFPVIRRTRLLQIVQTEGLDLDEEEELDQAVSFLHECGVLLHYEDTALQLRDFYFLDPGWLCRMMAQVITVHQINPFISPDGTMKKDDIKLLFKGKGVNNQKDGQYTFPPEMIPQYLKLLEKFEIALPHADKELLIPCRLPKERPTINLPVQNKNEKIFRYYCMPYTPIGLWSRLIARMIALADNFGLQRLLNLPHHSSKIYWREGIYVEWANVAFFLIDSYYGENEEICLTVPATRMGTMLLGYIVDHIDGLIEEWYPGLTSLDPILGRQLLERRVPCSLCPDQDQHQEGRSCQTFNLDELMHQIQSSDEVFCPQHNGNVPIAQLAPDIILNDLEPRIQLDYGKLSFVDSTDNQLGDGGFGHVYNGTYKDKAVAVKVFKEIADEPPLKLLRQEAAILRCLNHPSVVSLVGVCVRPPIIVLELAPHGTLGDLHKSGKCKNKLLQQRIALQVAEGLMYLHHLRIVYRDMKPDNVLIFSTSLNETVNAKISDYGISRFSTEDGLVAQEGTLGYRAPQVSRKENYSFQADVFSYGLTIYVMLTEGRHPFDEFESKSEMDRAIAENHSIPPITMKGGEHWPDMEYLLMQCLQTLPDSRPTSHDIWKQLSSPEVLSIKRVLRVSSETTVECVAVQECSVNEIYLWIASGNMESVQLSRIHLQDPKGKVEGTMFRYGRIMCLQAVDTEHLLIGTQANRIWLYNTEKHKYQHSTAELPDSVLCMQLIRGDPEKSLLLAGLANGKIAMFPIEELLQEPNADPVCLGPGFDFEPVRCMCKLGKKVFVTCGTQILLLNVAVGVKIEKMIETEDRRGTQNRSICSLAAEKQTIYFSHKASSIIHIWDVNKESHRQNLEMDLILKLPKMDARVTSLMIQDTKRTKSLWVGTGGGSIAIIDTKTLEVLLVTHRHTASVRALIHMKNIGSKKFNAVISGGLGFREGKGCEVQKNQCGCVLFWHPDIAFYCKRQSEYRRKRDEEILRHQPDFLTSL